MFPYDAELLASLQTMPDSVAGVVSIMEAIDAVAAEGDGLKWFNWIYLQVTQTVETRIAAGGFADSAYLSALDVQFARLYFSALESSLSGQPVPDCWQPLFALRNQANLTRLQFALAGMNAHINHDLPVAIVATCQDVSLAPQHGSAQYHDFTSLNATLDSLIDEAKQDLNVNLLGDPIPAGSILEDALASWSIATARETAWNNAELLWHLRADRALSGAFLDSLDDLTSVVGKTLLAPI